MKRLSILLFCAFALMAQALYAQKPLKQLPKQNEVFRPEALDHPICMEMVEDLVKNHGQKVKSEGFVKVPWDVYSDRDDNTTYSTPRAKDVYSSLKMGEKVRIARFKGDFALVYVPGSDDNKPYPSLPSKPEWKGWVPVSNLALWENPLVTMDGLPMRVLINAKVLTATPSDNMGKVYASPDPTAIPVGTLTSGGEDSFYYILKQEGNMVLLLRDNHPGNDLENLFGWVSRGSLYPWNNRVALEPNWEIATVEDFAQIGFSSSICTGLSEDAKIGQVSFQKKKMPYYRADYYRMGGNQWRFPLIGFMSAGFTSAMIPNNSLFLDDAAVKAESTNERVEDLNQVNVFFVLEGSRDLEDYFPAVVESLSGINSHFPGKNVRVGAVIYHDVRDEDFMTELQPLSGAKDRKMKEFIDQGGEYGFQDNASSPALLPALQAVIDDGQLRASETNIIIAVGARGDGSSLSLNAVADQLDGSNILLFGVQVQNTAVSAPNQAYGYQLTDLIASKLRARIEKTGSENDVVLQAVRHQSPLNYVSFALNTPDNLYLEQLVRQDDALMDEAVFKECLNELFDKVDEYIKTRQLEITAEEAKMQLFRSLWITSSDHSNRPFYKYVAIYDEEEFDAMMEGFEALYKLSQSSLNPNRQIFNILTNLLNNVPEVAPVKAQDRGYYEALRIIEGINVFSDEYNGVALKNIRDQKGFTPQEANTLLKQFAFKYQKLIEVKKSAYPYYSIINGRKYYWIPVDYLP